MSKKKKTEAKALVLVLDPLTDAQRYALYQSVEYHYNRIGDNYAGQDKMPVELLFAGQGTETALIRKGYCVRKTWNDGWGRSRERTALAVQGLKAGTEEFTRRRGLSPGEYAKQKQDARIKELMKRRQEVEKVSNLFTGMTVTAKNGRKVELKKFIFGPLYEGVNDPRSRSVEFSYKQLKQLGEQIQNLVP